MECGHALFPLVDCLMLHMKQPDSYHHHNRNNGSKATITLLKVTTLFKNNKRTMRWRKEKNGGGGRSIEGILGSKLYKRGLTFFKELGGHFLGSARCLINKNSFFLYRRGNFFEKIRMV